MVRFSLMARAYQISERPSTFERTVSKQLKMAAGEVWRGPTTLWVPPPDLPSGGGRPRAHTQRVVGVAPTPPPKSIAICTALSSAAQAVRQALLHRRATERRVRRTLSKATNKIDP